MGYAGKKLTDNDILKLFELHSSGHSLCSIGRQLGVAHHSVSWQLKKNTILDGRVVPINRKRHTHPKFLIESFLSQPEEDLAYWAGFITADGCLQKNSIVIELAKKDGHHLTWWSQFNASIRDTRNSAARQMVATHSKLIEWANSWGIIPRKTGQEKFPSHINDNLIWNWLRGLIDGDGYFTWTNGCLVGGQCSISKSFLSEIKVFLDKYEIKSRLQRNIRRPYLDLYKLIWYQRMCIRIAKHCTNLNLQLDRKWSRVKEAENKMFGMSDEDIGLIHRLHRQGLSMRKIAKIVNRDPKSIRYRLQQTGGVYGIR